MIANATFLHLVFAFCLPHYYSLKELPKGKLLQFVNYLNIDLMTYEIILERTEHLKYLIQKERTGTPAELAEKLQVSISTVYRMIRALKQMGEPIGYSKLRQTYYYKD